MASKRPVILSVYDGVRVSDSDVNFGDEKSLTDQSFKQECDINRIMAKYLREGRMHELVAKDPQRYGDVSELPDFLSAQNVIAKAQAQFETLPSRVRAEVNNDPAKFLERMQTDPAWAVRHELAFVRKEPEAKPPVDQGSGGGRPPEESKPVK